MIVRDYSRFDFHGVKNLLVELPILYPNSEGWLERRLSEVLQNQAHCYLATDREFIIGVAIDTPKAHRWKLSTIYVNPEFRMKGVGTKLIKRCEVNWKRFDVAVNIVTVRSSREFELTCLLSPFGFQKHDEIPNRYGPGFNEVILRRVCLT